MAAETGDETARLRTTQRRLGAWGRRVDDALESVGMRSAVALLVGLSVLVWAAQSIAWPVVAGRDLGTYLRYYAQMWDWHAVFPQAMVGRTIGAPLVLGGTLELGPSAVEVLMAVLFVASVLCWTVAAASFGRRSAALVAVLLLLYPGYGAVFHQFSSDALAAAAFAFWGLGAVRVASRPTVARFAALGCGAVVLVLIRPGNQVLLAVGLVALALAGPWRVRIARAAAFFLTAAALLGIYGLQNDRRYDDFTVARGTNIGIPFLRAFSVDRIVSPDNGPASRQLAEAVRTRLLPEEPYRSYGIDLQEFFSSGSDRMMEDVASLTDRAFGWDSDYAILRRAGLEAVRKHPSTYARGVAGTLWGLLRTPAYVTPPEMASSSGGSTAPSTAETIVVGGRSLPKPSEGDLIPASHQALWASTPDDRLREVWTSPTEHHLAFRDPGDRERAERVEAEIGRLSGRMPDRSGNAALAHRLNQVAYRFPPPALWLLVGVVAAAIRRPGGAAVAVALAAGALLLLLVTALGFPSAGEYTMPVAPAFALLAAAGLFGARAAGVYAPRP